MMPMLLTERARIISTIHSSFSASCGACKAWCEIRCKKSYNCGVVPRAMGAAAFAGVQKGAACANKNLSSALMTLVFSTSS